MSWTIAEPGQVSKVGTTRPTPLPERVGAKHKTCSGAVMAQIVGAELAEHHAVRTKQARVACLARRVAQRAEP
jgi:hypothetical protein